MIRSILSVMAAAALCGGAMAGDNEEIVVTASRGERSSGEVAASVTVIPGSDIADSGGQSVVDVLRKVEGIVVQSVTENPAMAEVNMRGFAENGHGRVLVLLDGRRLNWPSMANVNWLQVPAGNIDRIEVVRGGNSVLYGDHAVAGVINIITSEAVSEKPGSLSVAAGSHGLLNGSFSYSASADAVRLGANLEHNRSDGYRDRSAFESSSFAVRAGSDMGDSASLSANILVQSDEYELPGYLSRAEMDADPRSSNTDNDSADNEYFMFHSAGVAEVGDSGEVEVDLSFSRRKAESDMASWYSYSDTTLDSLAVMPRYTLGSKAGEAGPRFTAGCDFYSDELSVDRFDDSARSMASLSATVEKQSVGGYLHGEYAFEGGVILGAGVRSEVNRVSAEVGSAGTVMVDEDKDHKQTVYEVSVLKKTGKTSKVFLKYGTVYRYPFIDEQVSMYGYGSEQFYNDIEAEEGWNIEAGTDMSLSDQLRLAASVFVLEMKDEIAWNGADMRNENLDKTRRAGADVSLVYRPYEGLDLSGSYSYISAEFANGENDGKEIPLVPEHKAVVSADADIAAGLSAVLTVSYYAERWLGGDRSNSGDQLDAYTLTDLRLVYEPSSVEGLSVFAGVDNLFDEQYASTAYKGYMADGYYPAPGTVFKGGVNMRF